MTYGAKSVVVSPQENLSGRIGPVEWAVSKRCYPGESVCGDLHSAIPTKQGCLLMVADGLGHGPSARQASQKAVEMMAEGLARDTERSILIENCHKAMRTTRGAAVSFAFLEPARGCFHWLGIGNVEGFHYSAGDMNFRGLMQRGGILGHRLPPLRFATATLAPGDQLVIATDGLAGGFESFLRPVLSPVENAKIILSEADTGKDDALVLVARLLAEEAPNG